MKHKIWIELPEHDQEEHARLATIVLHKLGYNEAVKIDWTGERYDLTLNEAGEFIELADNGHWFDLYFCAH